MALRAGYYGMKKNIISNLLALASDLSGAVIIKSIGEGLKLSEAGELSSDGTSSETPIDFTGYTDYIQNAGTMSINKTKDSAVFAYATGNQIGARIGKLINVSGLDFIKVSVDITSIYSASFPVKVGLATSTSNIGSGTYQSSVSLAESGDMILDVRGVNGDLYLVFDGSGANVTFSDGVIISQNVTAQSRSATKKTNKNSKGR